MIFVLTILNRRGIIYYIGIRVKGYSRNSGRKRENGVIRSCVKWLKRVWLHKAALIGCNAMLLPFLLPTAAWIVICLCYSALLSAATGVVGGAFVLLILGLLPCGLIYAVGFSGATYCHKSLYWDGNGDIRKTFAAGIKKNALTYLLCFFIMWASLAVAFVTPTLYTYMGNAILAGAGGAVAVIQSLIIVPAMCIVLAQCAFYTDRLRSRFYNAFKLYFLRPLRTLGLTVACMLPFAICTFLPFVPQLVFWVLYAVVGVTVAITLYLVRVKARFDAIVSAAGEQAELPYDETEYGEEKVGSRKISDDITVNKRVPGVKPVAAELTEG